jgi:hypothetical protein
MDLPVTAWAAVGNQSGLVPLMEHEKLSIPPIQLYRRNGGLTMTRTMASAIAAAAISLAACSSSKPVYTADGQQGHVVTCTPGWTGGIIGAVANASTSWGQCYERAGEICGTAGYDIIKQVGEGGVYGQAGDGGGFVSSTNNRMMVVKCKNPAVADAKRT